MQKKPQNKIQQISKEDVVDASTTVGITSEQAEYFWNLLSAKKKQTQSFNFFHIFFYLGTLLLLFALAWLGVEGYSIYGAKGLFFISLASSIILTILGGAFWKTKTRHRV